MLIFNLHQYLHVGFILRLKKNKIKIDQQPKNFF